MKYLDIMIILEKNIFLRLHVFPSQHEKSNINLYQKLNSTLFITLYNPVVPEGQVKILVK